jgi:hypothetical protein
MKELALASTFIVGLLLGNSFSKTEYVKEPVIKRDTIMHMCTTYVPIKVTDVKPIEVSYKAPEERININPSSKVFYSNYRIASNASNYFPDERSFHTFIKYVKTQSGRLDDDNWYVLQVMLNRMDSENCDWNTYFNTPSINCSNSIKRMKRGKLKETFSYDNPDDAAMVERVKAILDDTMPDSLKIPVNVLYFESFDKSPNKGVHRLKNLFAKKRHKFYKKCQ